METPGLAKLKPLRRPKDQQAASDLLASTWDVTPKSIRAKLQALGLGPKQPAEPELTDLSACGQLDGSHWSRRSIDACYIPANNMGAGKHFNVKP